MAGFFSRIFGKSGGSADRGEATAYKGYLIYPTPHRDGTSWRTAGVIARADGEETQEHEFIRADVFASREEAEACALRKGQQIIDERGDRLFASADAPSHG